MTDPSNFQFRARRRECGLMQEDVAFLLGLKGPSSVSRFESLAREPDIRSALACEIILGTSVRELFAPLFALVERSVRDRARARLEMLGPLTNDKRHDARLARLADIAEPSPTLF